MCMRRPHVIHVLVHFIFRSIDLAKSTRFGSTQFVANVYVLQIALRTLVWAKRELSSFDEWHQRYRAATY